MTLTLFSDGMRLGRVRRWFSAALAALVLMASLVCVWGRASAAPPRVVMLADFQALSFVWASGTPEVQALAQAHCQRLQLTNTQCDAISAVTRTAWRDLIALDPAAVGRVGAHPNLAARGQILAALTDRLARATGNRTAAVLNATAASLAHLRDPAFLRTARRRIGQPIPGPTGAVTQLVWATAYAQTQLPPGMTTMGSRYAALPDLYLSMANVGNGAAIPPIYQPYYWPGNRTAHWAVTVSTATHTVSDIVITDVGPWNEDDNWWDPNGTATSPPAGCPVAGTLVATDATRNPLVNGICPNGRSQRRLYYYLLYGHGGLPFFKPAAYGPSGTFADGSAWPAALPINCAETTVASINDAGIACAGRPGTVAYNAHHGAWLRDGTNDAPILNQASIDFSPAVDAALGWVYPSSGLVSVDVAHLP